MFRKTYTWKLIILLCVLHQHTYAQHRDGGQTMSASLAKLVEMKSAPDQYSEDQRFSIYDGYISEFYLQNPDTIIPLYREMIGYGESINDSFLISGGYNSIAFMHQYSNAVDSNLHYLRKALTFSNTDNFRGLIMGSIGTTMMILDLDSASYFIDASIIILEDLDEKSFLASAYLQKSELLRKKNKYHSALKFAIDAVEVSEHAMTKMKRADALSSIGGMYLEIKDTPNAESYLRQALDICLENGYVRSTAGLYSNLGNMLISSSEFSDALTLLEKAGPIYLEKSDVDNLMINKSNISYCYLKLGDLARSKSYLDEAWKLLPACKFEGSKSTLLLRQGFFHLHTKEYTKANPIFQEMLELNEKLDRGSEILFAKSGLQKAAEGLGDWKAAYKIVQSRSKLIAKRDLAGQKSLIYDLEEKYQTDLKNAELGRLIADQEVKDLTISRRNRQLIFSLIGLLLALGLVFAVYRAYSVKRKLNEELSVALETNKMLIKEIHHRVKNNLQVVSSLLNIQSRFEKDDSVLKAINAGKYRVQSMSILHQNLYVNEDLTSVRIKDYFTDLITSIVDGYPLAGNPVDLDLQIEDIYLDIDTLIPLGLIANELVTNSLKYAFDEVNKANKLAFSIKLLDQKVTMTLSDNGPGLSFDSIPSKSDTMGMQLIQSFAKKLKAGIEVSNTDGLQIVITFLKPEKAQKMIHAAS